MEVTWSTASFVTVAPAPAAAKMSLICRASFSPQVCVTGWPIGVPSVAVSVNVTVVVNAAGYEEPGIRSEPGAPVPSVVAEADERRGARGVESRDGPREPARGRIRQ